VRTELYQLRGRCQAEPFGLCSDDLKFVLPGSNFRASSLEVRSEGGIGNT